MKPLDRSQLERHNQSALVSQDPKRGHLEGAAPGTQQQFGKRFARAGHTLDAGTPADTDNLHIIQVVETYATLQASAMTSVSRTGFPFW